MMRLIIIAFLALASASSISCSAGDRGRDPHMMMNHQGNSHDYPSGSIPTARMIALAHILAGTWVENDWFSESDVERVKDLRIAPGGASSPHQPFVDQIKEPETCSVARNYLTHSGDVHRVAVIEIDCKEYWQEIAYVDQFFDQRGILPASSFDLAAFMGSARIEWQEER